MKTIFGIYLNSALLRLYNYCLLIWYCYFIDDKFYFYLILIYFVDFIKRRHIEIALCKLKLKLCFSKHYPQSPEKIYMCLNSQNLSKSWRPRSGHPAWILSQE